MKRRRQHIVPCLLPVGLALTLSACPSGASEADDPTTSLGGAMSTALAAAQTATGSDAIFATGQESWQDSDVTIGVFTTGDTYSVFVACTGGKILEMKVAGTDASVECDGEGHRVIEKLVMPTPTAQISVVGPESRKSQWGIALVKV